LHEVVKSLFIEFVGKATNDLLCLVAVDSNSQAQFNEDYHALKVHKSSLIDRANAGLINVIPHGLKFVLESRNTLEHEGRTCFSIRSLHSVKTFIKLAQAFDRHAEVAISLEGVIFRVANIVHLEDTGLHLAQCLDDTNSILKRVKNALLIINRDLLEVKHVIVGKPIDCGQPLHEYSRFLNSRKRCHI